MSRIALAVALAALPGTLLAQTPTPEETHSVTPLAIITIVVILFVIAAIALSRWLSGRSEPASATDDGERSDKVGQAAAAVTAFEKAKLVGMKAQGAKAGDTEDSDEQPS